MHPFIASLSKLLTLHADDARAAQAKAYLLHQFDMFGITAAPRRAICKDFLPQNPLTELQEVETLVKELFGLPQREYHYCAIELYAYYKKLWRPSSIHTMEYGITHKSWWDSVDGIASEWTGPYFKLFPEQAAPITGGWNRSNNMWLQRSSIMFQKAYKKQTDTALLAKHILHLAGSKEFFIQKAIGWALREYGKTDAAWVRNFVGQHPLPALSQREALRRMDE